MTLSTDSTALQIIRMINAPRERVYAAWTDADLAGLWWDPDGCDTEELILDAWRGGRFRWLLSKKVLPSGNVSVTVEFWEKKDNTVTELRLTHEKLPDEPSRDNHIKGWNDVLDKLERLFATESRA